MNSRAILLAILLPEQPEFIAKAILDFLRE
jgi:hypothetical protein